VLAAPIYSVNPNMGTNFMQGPQAAMDYLIDNVLIEPK